MKFVVTATEEYVSLSSWPTMLTRAEAEAIAANFPKATGIRIGQISGFAEDGSRLPADTVTMVTRASIKADGNNGGRNETGIKRLKRTLAVIAAQGYGLEYRVFGNSITAERLAEILA